MAGRTVGMIRAAIGDFRLNRVEQSACAHLLTVLVFGEQVAEAGARQQSLIAPAPSARRFLRTQARHEAFHAFVFQRARDLVRPRSWTPGPVPRPLAALQAETTDACRRQDFPRSLLLQQVYLEGFGHLMLERLDAELGRVQHLPRLRRLILNQEAQHHQFGIEMLRRYVAPGTREADALHTQIHRLNQIMDDLLGDLQESLGRLDPQVPNYRGAFRESLPGWLGSAT